MMNASHPATALSTRLEPALHSGDTLRLYPPSKVRPRKVKTIRALDRGLEVLQVLLSTSACSLRDLHKATRLFRPRAAR